MADTRRARGPSRGALRDKQSSRHRPLALLRRTTRRRADEGGADAGLAAIQNSELARQLLPRVIQRGSAAEAGGRLPDPKQNCDCALRRLAGTLRAG